MIALRGYFFAQINGYDFFLIFWKINSFVLIKTNITPAKLKRAFWLVICFVLFECLGKSNPHFIQVEA